QGRTLGTTRRRRLLAPHAHPARAEHRRRPHPDRTRAAARRAARPRARAVPRARRADRVHRPPARAARRRSGGPQPPERRPAPGPGEHRLRLRLQRRGGRTVVADSRNARAVRTAGRLNEPRPARVEANFDGTPWQVNHQPVAVLREEWRVLDRWWTEEPVVRRYFEVVLETGENTVVFHDGAGGRWFTQRGA